MSLKKPGVYLLALISISLASPSVHADFGGHFEEAQNKAEKLSAEENRNGEAAADTLETAGTVKTVADWVGVSATAATIGTELYDWAFEDDEKLRELDAEYRAAIDAGNSSRAEEVLAELNRLNEKKKVVAKDQASTQKSLGTIQKVAGFANLGAATGSFASAIMGYNAANKLEEGKIGDGGKTRNAKKAAKGAANVALIYGAGEAVVGLASLHLAKKHNDRAKSLESLADDLESDLPTDVRMDIDALFDQAAVTKCGAGAEYRVLGTGGTVEEYDPDAPRVAGDAGTDDVLYNSIYNRVDCLSDPPVADSGDGTGTDGTTTNVVTSTDTDAGGTVVSGDEVISCSSEVFACPDGSFVGRVASNGCQFAACPNSSTTADATGATDGPSRELTTSGASRLQLDDVGAEIEQNQEDILQNF